MRVAGKNKDGRAFFCNIGRDLDLFGFAPSFFFIREDARGFGTPIWCAKTK